MNKLNRLKQRVDKLLKVVGMEDVPSIVIYERDGRRRAFRCGVELAPDTPAGPMTKVFVGINYDDI